MKLAIILISALLLGACASYDGRGLQPGVSSIEDIQRVMGEPAKPGKRSGDQALRQAARRDESG